MFSNSCLLRQPTQRELERSITHFDLDREIWEAKRKRFVFDRDTGLVVPVKPISGGLGAYFTGTGPEIYSNPLVGTAKTTFTTEFMINDTTGMGPAPVLPAFYFLPSGGRGKALRIIARGIASVTGTPTWIWTFRLNPVVTPAVPPTGPNVGSNAAATALSGVTNQLWSCELDVQMTLEGAGGNNSTMRGLGMVTAPGLFTPAASCSIFGGGATPGTVATFDFSLLNTLTVGATCSASSASNSIQLLQLLVLGWN